MNELLNNDMLLSAIIGLATALWGVLRATDWYARRQASREWRVLSLVSAIVGRIAREYVERQKEKSETGKLSEDQKRIAKAEAIKRVRQEASARGLGKVDVVKDDLLLDNAIEDAVRQAKGK